MKNFRIIICLILTIVMTACSKNNNESNERINENALENINISIDESSDGVDNFNGIWPNDVDLEYSITENIFKVNYVLLTSGDLFEEPIKIGEGGEFLNLKLEELRYSEIIVVDNKFYRPWSAEALFSGEIIVKGDLLIYRSVETGFQGQLFFINQEYANEFPFLVNDSRGNESITFDIINDIELFELLGINEEEIYFGMEDIRVNDIIIKIDRFLLRLYPSNVGNSAEIIEVISWSGQILQ